MNRTPDPNELVPLGLIAAEIGEELADLARRVADDVRYDDLGLRCVGADVARRLLTEAREAEARRAEQRAERERRSRERHAEMQRKHGIRPLTTKAIEAAAAEAGMTGLEYVRAQAAEREKARTGRTSPLREFLAHQDDALRFHRIGPDDGAA